MKGTLKLNVSCLHKAASHSSCGWHCDSHCWLETVKLTTLLKHSWWWDYLNALASGDVWIIIQPFFRRLEPQAAAVSRKEGKEEWEEGKDEVKEKKQWWHHGENQKTRKMWREWHPLENPSNQPLNKFTNVLVCTHGVTHSHKQTQAHTYTYSNAHWLKCV